MGDIISVLGHLDLSPINLVVLVLIGAFLKNIVGRLEQLETYIVRHRTSIAIIKNKLDIEEDE